MNQSALASTDNTPESARPVWLYPAIIVSGVAICTAGGYFLETIQTVYYPPDHGQSAPPPWYVEAVRIAMIKNNAIGFAVIGSVLLGILTALAGLSISVLRMIIGLIVGALAGLLLGAAAGATGYYIQDAIYANTDIDVTFKAMIIWSPVFAGYAVAGGVLASLVGKGKSTLSAFSVAIVATILALLVYVVAASALFPIGYPNLLLPDTLPIRQLCMLMLGLAVSITMVLVLRPASARVKKQSSEEA